MGMISLSWKVISFLASPIVQATVQGSPLCSMTFLFSHHPLKHFKVDSTSHLTSSLVSFKASFQTSLENGQPILHWFCIECTCLVSPKICFCLVSASSSWIPSCTSDFQPWLDSELASGLAASPRLNISLLWRILTRRHDNLKFSEHPSQGSPPIFTLFPPPFLRTSHFPIRGNALTIAFQTIDAPPWPFTLFLIYSSIDLGLCILPSLFCPIVLHCTKISTNFLSAKTIPNRYMFLSPHPPSSFRVADFFHFTKGIHSSSLLPVQRKIKSLFSYFFQDALGNMGYWKPLYWYPF